MSRQINLYNPALRARQEYLTSVTLLFSLVLIAIGVALTYFYYVFQNNKLREEAVAVDTLVKARRSEFSRLNEEASRVKRSKAIEVELATAEERLKGLERVQAALGGTDIGTSEGFSAYMEAFARQTVTGIWLTGITIGTGGSEMRIKGRTTDPGLLPVYLQKMNQEKSMRGRHFSSLDLNLPTTNKTIGASKPDAVLPNAIQTHNFTLVAALPSPESTATNSHSKDGSKP